MDHIKINNRLLLLAVGVCSSGISISRTLGILITDHTSAPSGIDTHSKRKEQH